MALDHSGFEWGPSHESVSRTRRARGKMAHYAGCSAESAVSRRYSHCNARLLHQRWRGIAGEIDLIFEANDEIVFVEVKQADCFDTALNSLRPRQIERLYQTADQFLDR